MSQRSVVSNYLWANVDVSKGDPLGQRFFGFTYMENWTMVWEYHWTMGHSGGLYSYGHLLVITVYVYGIIHSINGVSSVLLTGNA